MFLKNQHSANTIGLGLLSARHHVLCNQFTYFVLQGVFVSSDTGTSFFMGKYT